MSIEEKAKETIPDAFDNDEIFPVREGFYCKSTKVCISSWC